MRKLVLSLVGVGLMLAASPVASVQAQETPAEDRVAFGIKPTKAHEQIAESFNYFIHDVEPGGKLVDEALLINEGGLPVVLTLPPTP